jgi:spore maturation protein CgeB
MYKVLNSTAITLNNHIDFAGNEAANMRLFEATGAGSCLLTDWKENLNDIFEIDKEVVCYKSKEECLEKAKWLLSNKVFCQEIAHAGRERTLRDHTFEKRAFEIDRYIKTFFNS